MSGIIRDIIDCPQCGYIANQEKYYISDEEKVLCNFCGYHHTDTIEGGLSRHKGYGTIHYVSKNGSNNVSFISFPVNEQAKANILKDIKDHWDYDRSSLYLWNDTENKLIHVLGKKPKTIDEVYEEQREEAEYFHALKTISDCRDMIKYSK